jgi:hypothetical protein
MLLADAAQVAQGKLYILGGGWSVTGPGPVPSAIAIKIDVPWDQANRQHRFEVALFDGDGQPVRVEEQPVMIGGQFETGRPPGIPPGTPLDVPLAIALGPLPLGPGRYEWRCSIDGETREDWNVSFTVRGQGQAGRNVQ